MRVIRRRRTARIAVAGSLAAAGLLVVTAQAAGASWLELDTPIVPGASVWEFTSVSCTSPHICMAVGDSSGGTNQLLSENRTKKGWTIRQIPQPTAGSALASVWCTFSFSCIAVGDAPSGSNNTVPLAERWNGSSWQIQTTPAPKGAASSQLSAVTCATALDCVAVGSSSVSVNNQVPLVEHWNGTRWKIEKAPTRSGFIESNLTGVSCTSATRCIATGGSFKTTPKPTSVTLAELWNGSVWTIQKTPNSTNGGKLNAIACRSRSDCLAVGDGFGARWNGRKWSLVKLGFPGSPASLTSISCRAGVCYADGGFFQDAVLTGVIEFWNGSRWRVQNAAIATSNDSSLYNGISCTTAVNCTAVGSYHDPTNGNRALAEDFTLRWQNVSPQPFFGVTATSLNSVSCASPNSCLAVGTFSTETAFASFSDTWDGTQWSSQITPRQFRTNLDAVSCKTSSFCMAVGDLSTSGHLVTFAARWNGANWVIKKTPNPAGASSSFLVGISCPATSACTAVGFYVTPHGKIFLLAEQWNGKSWALKHTPNPTGKSGIEFKGVSCVSANACEAVAHFNGSAFAERWNGKSWAMQTTPLPKGHSDGFLAGVSCVKANSCLAVGDDTHGGSIAPIGERWNGKAWKAQQAAVPAHVTVSGLASVSCASANACEAVGSVSTSTTNAIAERWNGRSWALQRVDLPSGSEETDLMSLSCKMSSTCTAVGFYVDSHGMEQILAEQFS